MPKTKIKYRRYTRKVRKLTDIKYLVNGLVAHSHEARMIINQLPSLPGDQQWRLMYNFLYRIAPGNSEAERIYRLVNETEPYTQTVWVDGVATTVRIPTLLKPKRCVSYYPKYSATVNYRTRRLAIRSGSAENAPPPGCFLTKGHFQEVFQLFLFEHQPVALAAVAEQVVRNILPQLA